MKSLSFILVWLLSTAVVLAQEPKKIALIVAISEYKEGTGWNKLSSENDVPLIKNALKQQGFKDENIVILKDKPTKKSILNAIRKDLIAKAKPGDIAVFHFSGHGQQITDDNGDEADGYDEALVPYDAPQIAPRDYDISSEKHLRDDELGMILDTLRQQLGAKGNLLVLIDACHSGSATRGLSNFRGTANKFEIDKSLFKKASAAKKINPALFDLGTSKPGYSPMACYFASSADECNQEAVENGKGCGSLSLAFSKALAVANKNTSYRALFDAIKLQMSTTVPNQTPQSEGDLDIEIFGGKALGKPSYYAVNTILEDKKVSINCGRIMGVFSGTIVKLYPPETRDTNSVKPLAYGTIYAASQYNSQVELDKKLTDEQLKTAWIYLDAVNYGDLKVRVRASIADATLSQQIMAALSANKQVEIVNDNAELIIEQGAKGFNPDSINISNSGELLINRAAMQANGFNLSRMLDTTISNYARANYIRNLPLKNEDMDVEMELVPIRYTPPSGNNPAVITDLDPVAKKDAAGNITYEAGDRFRINIINKSNKRVYYTILDIQPDNQVNVLYPRRNEKAEDCFVKPDVDTLKLMNSFRIGPPYGTDILKVIASPEPVDLRPIFVARGSSTRGDPFKSPLQKLMQGTFNTEGIHTRGPEEETIPPSDINIFSSEYRIVPKK